MGRIVIIRLDGRFKFINIKDKEETINDLIVGVLVNPSKEHLKNVVDGMKSLGWKIKVQGKEIE